MLMLVLQNEQLCLNEGFCLPDCDREPFYRCSCPAGWEGPTCNLKVLFLLLSGGPSAYSLKVQIITDFFLSHLVSLFFLPFFIIFFISCGL